MMRSNQSRWVPLLLLSVSQSFGGQSDDDEVVRRVNINVSVAHLHEQVERRFVAQDELNPAAIQAVVTYLNECSDALSHTPRSHTPECQKLKEMILLHKKSFGYQITATDL